MYEITLEEILSHYISRVHMAIENIEKQKKDLEKLIELLDEGLSGELRDALNDKLEESINDTNEINEHLEDSLFFLKRHMSELEDMLDVNYPLF